MTKYNLADVDVRASASIMKVGEYGIGVLWFRGVITKTAVNGGKKSLNRK